MTGNPYLGGTSPASTGPSDEIVVGIKSLTLENPNGSEDFSFFFTDGELDILKLVATLRGADTPNVSWTLRYNSDRDATGTEVIVGGTTTTEASSGDVITSFSNGTIPADNFVWLETTATNGTVEEFSLTLLV